MKNTNTSNSASYNPRYVSFRDELEEDDISQSEEPAPTRMSDDIELVSNDKSFPAKANCSNNSLGEASQLPLHPKRIRLRAVESERDYFLNLMNVDLFRWLVLVQMIASMTIVISQVIMYAVASFDIYKALDYVGIGLWGPILFFAPTCWLSYVTIKSPSGCAIGSAMAGHIVSIAIGLFLIAFSAAGLVQHSTRATWRRADEDEYYDAEVPGRVFCSFMVLAAICVTVASIIACIQYCRIICCGRSKTNENLLFEVEVL